MQTFLMQGDVQPTDHTLIQIKHFRWQNAN